MISLNTGDKVRVHPLTYDSEVLVEQSHVDRQQLRQSDGQTAAQTDVRVSGVHYVQHWQRREIQRQKRFNKNVILSYSDWTNHVSSSCLSDARVWRRSLPTRSRWHQWRAADSRWAQTLETCREPQTATRPVSPPPPQTDVDTWRKKRKEYELELIKKDITRTVMSWALNTTLRTSLMLKVIHAAGEHSLFKLRQKKEPVGLFPGSKIIWEEQTEIIRVRNSL